MNKAEFENFKNKVYKELLAVLQNNFQGPEDLETFSGVTILKTGSIPDPESRYVFRWENERQVKAVCPQCGVINSISDRELLELNSKEFKFHTCSHCGKKFKITKLGIEHLIIDD